MGNEESGSVRAAIYCRISRDRAGGGLGVERQEADCRALAERLGWEVVAVYVDNDISAYSGAPRPQYREMLAAVDAKRVSGIVAWHTDRLHRRATELEEFVAVAERNDLQVQTVTAGTIDLTTASGRMVARMLGAAAQHEVDHARERMKRAKAQMAADGKYRGGPRPYGFEKDGLTIREHEAAVVREATESIIAGRSLRAIARELNERGLQAKRETYVKDAKGGRVKDAAGKYRMTSKQVEWTYARLRDVLVRPRNCGLLAHGRADRGDLQIVGKATWPAIIDEETWRACYTLLIDTSRRNQQNTATRWLGSGIYVCGICGGNVRVTAIGGTAARKNQVRQYHYRCEASAHLTVRQSLVDDYVRDVVAERIRDPRVAAAMQPEDTMIAVDRDRRAVLSARLEAFENDYANGVTSGAQLAKASAQVTSELTAIDTRLSAALQQGAASTILATADPGQSFIDAPIDVQRAVLAAVLRVEILPVGRGASRRPVHERLLLTPVGAETETAHIAV
ncbi:recombinase family protein [Demequina sp. NBRC 110051]|uniref:recombinase family protein n=1 Tax=Demequina sp. NBRC 110051 TaxID=1570340 RepID=UPI000A016FDD|nr:recombinase family protein [Demequina sp. NBRC 110051]